MNIQDKLKLISKTSNSCKYKYIIYMFQTWEQKMRPIKKQTTAITTSRIVFLYPLRHCGNWSNKVVCTVVAVAIYKKKRVHNQIMQ